ncbi:MAG: GtrA family protein, partial [Bacteroidales bacterium]|nr:GtrA family protein [Bacteroidales bacterium]
ANVCLDWLLYFICYNFIYKKQVIHLSNTIAFTPHIASLITVFPITFLTGFWLAKYVSFSNSNLRGRVQMFRYFTVVAFNFLFNYFGLKLLVEVIGIYPTPSKMIITVLATIISFLAQKYYSFRVKS